MMANSAAIDALAAWLDTLDGVAVALSGGIDSLTLSTVAGRTLGERATMYHAVSAAVPPEATARVHDLAARETWRLQIIDADEFGRDEYVANPVNRCFYCKQSLYRVIARHTDRQIVSGANTDDLSEYRPGLDAARAAGVRHPLVELGVNKATIRVMARALGLGALSALPASPCLSSRVETGIAITPAMLRRIDAAERALRLRVGASNVRCRVRASGIVVELDAVALERLSAQERGALAAEVGRICESAPPAFAPYRSGSAFLVTRDARARHPA